MTRSHDTYSIGVATGDITPPVGAPLAGFAARGLHTSVGVYHPLRAVATAIDDGRTTVVLLSAEILFFAEIAEQVRIAIRQATGVPDAHILLSGTHTHCGPSLRARSESRHGWVDLAYRNQAVEAMTRTAHTAWKYRFPARLTFSVGRCDFAVSRRKPDPDDPGRVLWAPDPEGPHDHDVSVLAVESPDGIVRGILFSYACHPTSRGGLLIGGDYPGFAYDRIQEAFPFAQPAFLQGCGADQKPMPADPKAATFIPRTIEQTREIGHQLGDAVIRTFQSGERHSLSGALDMRQSVIDLSTEPLDNKKIEEALRLPDDDFQKQWALHHRARTDAGLPEDRAVPFEIQTLRFGRSLAVIALSAEAVVGHALRLKQDLRPRFAHVLPLAYTGDVIGYVPMKQQFNEGGYEVISANQYRKRTGRFIEETEDRIHATVAGMLEAES